MQLYRIATKINLKTMRITVFGCAIYENNAPRVIQKAD